MAYKDYLILFADLVGSTEVASEASPSTFSKLYLGSFHLAADCALEYIGLTPDKNEVVPYDHVIFKKVIEPPKISGDEVLSFTPLNGEDIVDGQDHLLDVVASSVAYAFLLKAYWMASPYNILRLKDKNFPRDISVGIHIGPAETIRDDNDRDIAGLHINVAKRLESAGRLSQDSRILVSDNVAKHFSDWLAKYPDLKTEDSPPVLFMCFDKVQTPLDLKGIPVKASPLQLKLNEDHKKEMLILLNFVAVPSKDQEPRRNIAISLLGGQMLEKLFSDKHKFLLAELKRSRESLEGCYESKSDYVDGWFDAIKSIPNFFVHDIWELMISYFISCSFMRYSQLPYEKIDEYRKIISNLQKQLV